MKTVLGIMGSPRRDGNSRVMLDHLLAAAGAAGARTEQVLLADLAIAECNGCLACWKSGRCVKKDDMQPLYGKLTASDAIVFATPVYWYGPTAILKAFLDRFVYFNGPPHQGELTGKKGALLIPFEEDEPTAADLIIAMFDRSFGYLGIQSAGHVIAPGLLKKGQVEERTDVLAAAAALGRRLAGAAD